MCIRSFGTNQPSIMRGRTSYCCGIMLVFVLAATHPSKAEASSRSPEVSVHAAIAGPSRVLVGGLAITAHGSHIRNTRGARRKRQHNNQLDNFLSNSNPTPTIDNLHPWRITIQVRKQAADQHFLTSCAPNATVHPVDMSEWYHTCGGTLYDYNKVLTSAACVYGYNDTLEDIRIGAGWHDLSYGLQDRDDSIQVLDVARIDIHPDYKRNAAIGMRKSINLAVITLNSNVTLNPNRVKLAPLAGEGDFVDGDNKTWTCKLSGWGQSECGQLDKLRYLDMKVIKSWRCRNTWRLLGGSYNIFSNEICALDVNNFGSPCLGDAGGGLVCECEDEGPYVVGVTSWHLDGCKGCFPTVFERVHTSMTFINNA